MGLGTQRRGNCLQETVGCAASDDDAAKPDVDGCHFGGLLGLFIDAMVHYAEDELDKHCCYDKDAEDLMARVEFLALDRMSARSERLPVLY